MHNSQCIMHNQEADCHVAIAPRNDNIIRQSLRAEGAAIRYSLNIKGTVLKFKI